MSDPKSEPPFKGHIQVYTGNGKGKTTAALGLAFRAAGWKHRTFIGQFLKGQPSGELAAAAGLAPFITIEQFGREGFLTINDTPEEEDIGQARRGLDRCREALRSGEYRLVILDEVLVAVHFGLLSEADLLEFLDQKPGDVEVVLTGRFAPASVIDRADLVTDMTEVKHYYARGVRARRGIEK